MYTAKWETPAKLGGLGYAQYAAMAAQAYNAYKGSGSGGGGGGGGLGSGGSGQEQQQEQQAGAGASSALTSTIAVSPNIQTEVSPQISPVFQQTGSGSQSAGTSMIAPGGQSGEGGSAQGAPASASASPFGYPSAPTYGGSPTGLTPFQTLPTYPTTTPSRSSVYDDPFANFDVNRYQPRGYAPAEMMATQNWNDLIKWGILGAGVLTAAIVLPPLFKKKKVAG